MITLSTYIMSE